MTVRTDGPLTGVTVVDLTTALAGPYATLLLAGLGARVIKVEKPGGGETARDNAPYVGRDGLKTQRTDPADMSVSMLLRGRNKEAVTLDLKQPAGVQVLHDLVRRADVLVENYSTGVTHRLGIDAAALLAVNPRLVYTSITGFGTDNPGKAMDSVIQALSGAMLTSGEPGSDPVRFGLPIGDLLAPMYAVIGTLSALREVERTGQGQHVDVSMLGALTSLVACEPFDAYERLGWEQRTGNQVPRLAPFGIFATADGHVSISAPTDAFAHRVLTAIDRPDLVADPRFATRDARVGRADELHALIGEWTRGRTTASAVAALTAAGAPCAPVRSPAEAVADPLVRARNEVVPLRHPEFGAAAELSGTGLPIVFSRSQAGFDRPPPRLGEHNRAVFGELLGYSDADLETLRDKGVL
ncbi:CaiB/BaiF CoA transferase family protein [Cryptosporangium aurantiacum]|uniref:Crotonobetainyl-CoA:carnitine CoA-transferase CaiB n=1 Tax=Cryptosporangium aurantiacum TaxID=134849 RepID=A0A1M7TVW3_9ACTN|nr:CoA transferase [Cryptosporangium aurantiacum]SHN74858.1 Crotonobetainyl-CoA:carnitine CoA-transferase CaiB [Cryptosporangium aurantiacum]